MVELGRKSATIDVESVREARFEPVTRVELAFPTPKGNRADWLFEHGTELGISRFRPLRTRRSRTGRDNTAQTRRSERQERILRAAAEQCDRGVLPTLDAECDLEHLVADRDLPAERYIADLVATQALGTASSRRVLLVVGPEGGFEREEVELLDAHGFSPVQLGSLTLRVETAALVGCARLLAGENGRSASSANE